MVIILTKASPLFSIYDQSYNYSWLYVDVDFWRNLRTPFYETDIIPKSWLSTIFTTVVELRQTYIFRWNEPQGSNPGRGRPKLFINVVSVPLPNQAVIFREMVEEVWMGCIAKSYLHVITLYEWISTYFVFKFRMYIKNNCMVGEWGGDFDTHLHGFFFSDW